MIRAKNIIGQRFGRLVVVEIAGQYPDGRTKWKLQCDCGKYTVAPFNNLKHKGVISCGCYKKETSFDNKWRGIGSLGLDHFNSIKRGAKTRDLDFNITLQYASDLFNKQNKRCALSGKVITLSSNRKRLKPTASLDRINNDLGYVEGNVQWVHREINIAKNVVNNEEFIKICKDVTSFNKKRKRPIVVVSGGFDPVHVGHIQMFNSANQFGDVVAIVNSDDFLIRKKGKAFMPWKERMEVIKNLKAISSVVACVDKDQTVRKTLEIIKPDYFLKGGDSTPDNVPEKEICERLGIKLLYGIGGGKIQSSSWLINKSKL